MWTTFLTSLLLVTPAASARSQTLAPLHCRIELAAGAKSKRCKLDLPRGRRVRECGAADRQVGHCDAAGGGRYVAWVVGAGPGRCRISAKKTRWDRVVSAKLSKSTAGPSSCDLFVEVR